MELSAYRRADLAGSGLIRSFLRAPSREAAALVIGLLVLTRLGMAALVPLTPDEAYYTLWSRDLAFGYFDHPPLIALFIRAGTALLGETPLGVRLFCVLATLPVSWLVWRAAEECLADIGAGLLAAILFNLTLLGSFGMIVATPDVPLILFSAAMIYFAVRLVREYRPWLWLGLGLATGLAGEAKYSAFLLAAALALAALILPGFRRRLASPWPWLAIAVALSAFLPNLAWNAGHGFATFAKQGGRVTSEPPLQLGFVPEFIAAQFGLMTPPIFLLSAAGLLPVCRAGYRSAEARRLLIAIVLVPLAYFLFHALRDRVQGNWPGFLYPALSIAAAAAFLRAREGQPRWLRMTAAFAIPVGLALAALGTLYVVFEPLPSLGRLDPVQRETRGWTALARDVDARRQSAGAGYILTFGYQLNAELTLALPGRTVAPIDERERYGTLSVADPATLHGPGLAVSAADVTEALRSRFSSVVPLSDIERSYRGNGLEALHVYRVENPAGR